LKRIRESTVYPVHRLSCIGVAFYSAARTDSSSTPLSYPSAEATFPRIARLKTSSFVPLCQSAAGSNDVLDSEGLESVETFRLVEFFMLRIEYVDIGHSAKSFQECHSRCALVVTMVRSPARWLRRYHVTRHATAEVRSFGTHLRYLLTPLMPLIGSWRLSNRALVSIGANGPKPYQTDQR
jgi:hypothetical protein